MTNPLFIANLFALRTEAPRPLFVVEGKLRLPLQLLVGGPPSNPDGG